MNEIQITYNRNSCPCAGCARVIKRPGCHDHCDDYQVWKAEVDAINERRRKHLAKPFSPIL